MFYRSIIFYLTLLFLLNPLSVFADKEQAKERSFFDLSLTYAIDQDLPSFDPFDMLNPDPTYSFLREEVGMTDKEIAQMVVEAEKFYLERFGLDFRNVQFADHLLP